MLMSLARIRMMSARLPGVSEPPLWARARWPVRRGGVGSANRRLVGVVGADQDEVGALAGRARAALVGDAEVDRAVERGKLNQPLHRQRDRIADPVTMHREQDAHADERIAI